MSAATQRIKALEAELEEAIEQEDYAAAEEKQEELADLKTRVSSSHAIAPALREAVATIASSLRQQEEVVLHKADIQSDTHSQLHSRLQQQVDELKAYRSELQHATRTERARIQ